MAVYKNSTPLTNIGGVSLYMKDVVDACLMGRLNLFLQGDTGSGKTQLAADTMTYFPNESLFILGRNDMDTRELFQQVNLDKLRTGKSSSEIKELTDAVNSKLIIVDELPNCVPAVRAQLFNLFDGYIEISGKKYSIGDDYSVGIATGNIGQRFTESSNDLGRALKDRMHVIIDVDHFSPQPSDTLEILAGNTNPRVEFSDSVENPLNIYEEYQKVSQQPVPLEKLIIANYLIHGLDYCNNGASKRKMKESWPNAVDNHSQGSDEALVLPVSMRAAKSIIRLSQSFDEISKRNGGNPDAKESMLQAYKFVSAYSGILNDAMVQANYNGDKYSALDSIILSTETQFEEQKENISAGIYMVESQKSNEKVLNNFNGRWEFMKDTLNSLLEQNLGEK
ncbi:MAG: AAA family ATPase [Nanoarchaeota archaeon]|nr:AAA family ATPase [Nanoarchaeota archaeon]